MHPNSFLPDLAKSLSNLAAFLSDLERSAEALRCAEEAVSIRRGLAAMRPDAFLPGLAKSLSNLASFLSGLGRREEALRFAEEAVSIYWDLAAARPDAFVPDLAMCLGALSKARVAADMKREALASFAEGIGTLRPIFLKSPGAALHLIIQLCGDYISLAQELGVALDEELLGPIAEKLAEIQAAQEQEED